MSSFYEKIMPVSTSFKTWLSSTFATKDHTHDDITAAITSMYGVFNNSAEGYYKFPKSTGSSYGLMIQWGVTAYVDTTETTRTHYFATPFNTIHQVILGNQSPGASIYHNNWVQLITKTVTYFQWFPQRESSSAGIQAVYLAIGTYV